MKVRELTQAAKESQIMALARIQERLTKLEQGVEPVSFGPITIATRSHEGKAYATAACNVSMRIWAEAVMQESPKY